MEILLDTLKWSGAVGAAALFLTLLRPVLDRRYSAQWRYGVWLAMAVLLLLAPMQWDAVLSHLPGERPVVLEAPEMEISVSPQTGLTVQPSFAGSADLAGYHSHVFPLAEALMILWLSGAALFLLYHLAGTWRLVRRARRWSLPAGEETTGVYEAVCREMGLKRPPSLRLSATVDSPMALGLLRPLLLLPEEAFHPQELSFILRHELTHCQRHDLWYKLILLAANALHWFNPLIWLLRREAERDLELTCDDAVVAGTNLETRRAYSETLLASVRRQRERSVLSTHFYGGKNVLKERFRNILGMRGQRRGTAVLILALLVTVAAAGSVDVRASVLESAPEIPVRVLPAPHVPGDSDAPENPDISGAPENVGSTENTGAPENADTSDIPTPSTEAAAPAPAPVQAPDTAVPSGGNGETAGLAFDPFAVTPTRIFGDFDGDGTPDEVFLEQYTIVDDPETHLRFYVPRNPGAGYPSMVSEVDPETELPYSIYNNDLLGIPVAAGIGLPEPRTSTGTPGDYDGDGARDTQIEINGQTYPLVWDPETQELEPLPGTDLPFSITADYDGDGRPDSEVQINGQRYQITQYPDGSVGYAEIN